MMLPIAWTAENLHDGLPALVEKARFSAEDQPLAPVGAASSVDEWMTASTARLGIGVEALTWQYGNVPTLVRNIAPAVLRLPTDDDQYLLLLRTNRRTAALLTPEKKVQRIPLAQLVRHLQPPDENSLNEAVASLLVETGIPAYRIDKARNAMLAQQMSDQQFHGCWQLQAAHHVSTWRQLRGKHILRYVLIALLLGIIEQLITVFGWRLIGSGVFSQNYDQIVITAWVLLLFTAVPLSILSNWAQINLTLNLGHWMRTNLLQGILNLRPSDVRQMGAGQFLGRVMQTESLQPLLLGNGFAVLTAIVQFILAVVVLGVGSGGWMHSWLLIGWLVLTTIVVILYIPRFGRWQRHYHELTNDLVERMVAHRTRIAQEDRKRWHIEEDVLIKRYHRDSAEIDRWQLLIGALLNRGWFVLGLLGIALPFIAGTVTPTGFAISLGGVLLASNAFNTLSNTLFLLIDAIGTWDDVRPMFAAAREQLDIGVLPQFPEASTNKPLMVMQDLAFRYRPNRAPVFDNLDLTVYPGDRLLLEGASGGGKSTLGSLLTGLRAPSDGLLLLHGLDRQTFGVTNWRKRAVSAPQFHENHIFTGTLAFNLLMGRRWPAQPQDLRDAAEICDELGLRDLLERMPGGLMQMVGESGWQLSHGERSRLYIARALLQETQFIVLDESFGALDPDNLRLAIECVLRRAKTVLVIAHP